MSLHPFAPSLVINCGRPSHSLEAESLTFRLVLWRLAAQQQARVLSDLTGEFIHVPGRALHVLIDGKVAKTGCGELALELEKVGYGEIGASK